jgi:dTMP kinase
MGYDAVYTTEPSRGIYGRIIRKHILQGDSRVPTVVEAVLFAADRIDHVRSEIEPLLNKGKIVVCDRYVYSSIAYQGAADLDTQWIKEINCNAIDPDFVVYIDVPPGVVTSRIQRRRSVMETRQTQEKVRSLYLKLVEEEQLAMVYGNASIKEVAQAILNMVLKFLESTRLSANSPP